MMWIRGAHRGFVTDSESGPGVVAFEHIEWLPLLLLSGIQLAAILLAASERPVWPHQSFPRSSAAVSELTVITVWSSALLGPALSRTWHTILAVSIVTIGYMALAGFLSRLLLDAQLEAITAITIWQVGICGWFRRLERNGQALMSYAISTTTIGLACVSYLATERAVGVGKEISESFSWLVDLHAKQLIVPGCLVIALPMLSLVITVPFFKNVSDRKQ